MAVALLYHHNQMTKRSAACHWSTGCVYASQLILTLVAGTHLCAALLYIPKYFGLLGLGYLPRTQASAERYLWAGRHRWSAPFKQKAVTLSTARPCCPLQAQGRNNEMTAACMQLVQIGLYVKKTGLDNMLPCLRSAASGLNVPED